MVKIFRPIDGASLLELFSILVVASLLSIALQKVLPWVANRLHGKHRLYLLAVVPLLRFLVLLATFGLSVPPLIEPSVQSMVALLGTLGLALGFALKDFVSRLVAGLVAVWEMPYRIADWIEMGDIYGEVTRVGMRVVRIVTPDDTVQEKPWGTQYRLRAYPIDPRQQFRFKTDLTVRGKAALALIGVAFAATPTTAGESA